jgi:hypothetical protein
LDDDPKSNLLRMAGRLQGRLLITSDLNAPLGGTMRMIGALERAGKSYDLVLLPEMDHAAQNSPYSLGIGEALSERTPWRGEMMLSV